LRFYDHVYLRLDTRNLTTSHECSNFNSSKK